MSTVNIIQKYQDRIVSIQAGIGEDVSTGSGYIYYSKNKRLYIATCAHLILNSQGIIVNSPSLVPINVDLTNVYIKGKDNTQNVICSVFIVGMDISADIALLATFRPEEVDSLINLYGFNFSSRNIGIPFVSPDLILDGTPVGIIANEYGSGFDITSGVISKSSFVYGAENPNYTNYTAQLISNIDVAVGSSGAPVLMPEGVISLACWTKTSGGSYVGGPNYATLENSLSKIIQLNLNPSPSNSGINFDGSTGSGFIGVGSYIPYQGFDANALCLKYPLLASSEQASSLSGLILTSITNPLQFPLVIPKSRIQNAKDVITRKRTGLQVDDIILELNGTKVGYSITTAYVNFDTYYDINTKVLIKIFRPSTGQNMTYEVTPDEYPSNLNIVSIDSTIELISNDNFFTALPPGYSYSPFYENPNRLVKDYPLATGNVKDSYDNYVITSILAGYTVDNKNIVTSITFTHYVSPILYNVKINGGHAYIDPLNNYSLTYDVNVNSFSKIGKDNSKVIIDNNKNMVLTTLSGYYNTSKLQYFSFRTSNLNSNEYTIKFYVQPTIAYFYNSEYLKLNGFSAI